MMEKDKKNQFKIFWNSMFLHFHHEIFEFQKERLFVTIFWNWFYIVKSMFSEIYLKIFHWKSITFSVFRIQFSLWWRIFLIDHLPDSSCFWFFVGQDFNFSLDLFKIGKLVLVGDFEVLKQKLDKKSYFFTKFRKFLSTLESKF